MNGRRGFTIGSIVVAVLVAIALGYSVVRDPGPQPPVPPEITGTDDGGLKRAIVHYVGAVASRDPEVLVDYMVPSETAQARARTTIDEYGDIAQQAASVVVADDQDASDFRNTNVRWADGREQDVSFSKEAGGGWKAQPSTAREMAMRR